MKKRSFWWWRWRWRRNTIPKPAFSQATRNKPSSVGSVSFWTFSVSGDTKILTSPLPSPVHKTLVLYHSLQIRDDMNPIHSLLLWHGWVFKIKMTLLRLKVPWLKIDKGGLFHVSGGWERGFLHKFLFRPGNHQCRLFENETFLHFLELWFQLKSDNPENSHKD